MNNDAILASISKIHAYRYAKEKQRGAKLGYAQVTGESNTTGFVTNSIPIGTEDFSIEFFGNSFGSENYDSSVMMNKGVNRYDERSFYVYNTSPDTNGLSWILFEKPNSGELTDDSILLNWKANEIEEKYLLTITRQGTTVKVYIKGELKATKEQSAVKDLGDLQLAIASSSDVGFVRVWNMCLSADEITTLYNNGNPLGYVVPKAIKSEGKCIAEYLPQNLVGSSTDKTIATTWLDSAKQLPWSDKYNPPLLQSKGGYDMVANGAPEVLFKEQTETIGDFSNDFSNDFN